MGPIGAQREKNVKRGGCWCGGHVKLFYM
jgi:hypothetical protein